MSHIFITGIGTEIGKTVISAIVVEALEADYFKPIQAGDLDNSDTHKVKRLVNNTNSKFHESAYKLNTPMSPHASAEIDNITISAKNLKRPSTQNTLVIEGAGGVLVPLNGTEMIIDLITKDDQVIVVSKHYLGSINHTLLTIEALKARGLKIAGIIFNGEENPTTEEIILSQTQLSLLGKIEEEPYIDEAVVRYYAAQWKENLKKIK